MEETISLLREQTILCSRLLKLFADLIIILKSNSLEMAETIKKIEPLITELSRNAEKSQLFLKKAGVKTFGDFLDFQEQGVKLDVARRLLNQAENLQARLKNQTESASRLLENGGAFVSFNLNVLSQTAAGGTYGAEAVAGSQRTRRIFDANV